MESEDSQRTRAYDDQEADLVLDEAHWSYMTAGQKICANTGSFTVPRDIEGIPVMDVYKDLQDILPMRILIRHTQTKIMLTDCARTRPTMTKHC